MAKRKYIYPGTAEAEAERAKGDYNNNDDPDFICGAPNYDKFKGWTPEEILVFLNVD